MSAELDVDKGCAKVRLAVMAMYDTPDLRPAYDTWWRHVAASLRAADVARVPEALARDIPVRGGWADPDLLLSQTCGYPFTTGLRGRVRYVATPHYDAPGCAGPYYCSFVLVRTDDSAAGLEDLRGRTVAFNGPDSHSGYNVLRRMIAPLTKAGGFFGQAIRTGSHRASMAAVREDRADVCAVDCVSHALWTDHDPGSTAGLRILERSPSAPGLPLITSLRTTEAEMVALRRALLASAADSTLADVRRRLRIGGFSTLDVADYHAVLEMENAAIAANYEVLR